MYLARRIWFGLSDIYSLGMSFWGWEFYEKVLVYQETTGLRNSRSPNLESSTGFHLFISHLIEA
jgi:hypothetical protein